MLIFTLGSRSDTGDTPLMMAIIGGHVEAVRKLVTNVQVDLEDLDYRDRINFDNGHIVHGFLTILGIIDEAKQERFRMSINILRLGDGSDTEVGESREAAPEVDEVQMDLRSIISRVDTLRDDLMAQMCDYDDTVAHFNSLDKKHERETSGMMASHLREIQAIEASHSRQLRALKRRQTEEKAKVEAEKLKKKNELEVVRKDYLHLLDNQGNEVEAAAPEVPCPTCPVCLERLVPPMRILQCINGHLLCERCRSQPQIEVNKE